MQKAKTLEMKGPDFKREKRKQFKQLMSSMFTFRDGSAYLPEEAYISIQRAFTEMKHAHKICHNWWKSA